MKTKSVFDKKYFDSYYYHISGSFSQQDLEKNKRWYKGWLDFINNYVPIYNGRGKKLLEVGAAIAAPSNLLTQKGYEVTATDFSPKTIAKAAKLSNKIHFRAWDVQTAPAQDLIGRFDLVLGFEVIEHLKDPQKAISNFYKLLKKGGWCILSTPYPYRKSFNDATHINVRYPRDWKRTLEAAGFDRLIVQEATFVPFLYRYSAFFSRGFGFGTPLPFLNSTVLLMAQKK